MRNEIAKQIINCRSGREGVAKILNGVSLESGTLGGETSAFAVAALDVNSGGKLPQYNPLYDALNKTKVSRMYYQWYPDSEDFDMFAHVWKKDGSTGYQQVIADFGWSDPVAELPEGAESSGEKSDDELNWNNEGNWYEETTGEGEAEETLYYQVIVTDLYWGIDPSFISGLELPEDTEYLTYEQLESIDMTDYIEGPKDDSDLVEEYMFQYWFYDNSAFKKYLQDMVLTPNPINTAIFYKQLDVAQEDIDDLNDSGEYNEFLDWVNFELRRNVEDYIITSMFNSGDYNESIYCFYPEHIDETFTYLMQGEIDLSNLTEMVNNVCTEYKWLIINPNTLNTLLDDNGLKDKYELAGRLNVDYVYVTYGIMEEMVVCLDPNEFWLREKNTLEVAYPVYHENKVTFLYEKNVGIKPHSPLCSGMLYNFE